MVKESESEFARMCAKLNIWCKKWQDVRYCPNCRKPIFMTRRTDVHDTEQTESIVDYLIFMGAVPMWVECKGKPGHARFPLGEITVKQAQFQLSWIERGVKTSLFVSFGPGRAPAGRGAWWIDWIAWRSAAKLLLQHNQKSLPWNPEMLLPREVLSMDSFSAWQLTWQDGGWTVPHGHPYYQLVAELPSLYLRSPDG